MKRQATDREKIFKYHISKKKSCFQYIRNLKFNKIKIENESYKQQKYNLQFWALGIHGTLHQKIPCLVRAHFLFLRRLFSCCVLMAQSVKNLPSMQETWVRLLGREDPLEKEMATHSSILAWRIPWTKEPGRLQSMGLQKLDTTQLLYYY